MSNPKNELYLGVGYAVVAYQIMEKTYIEAKQLNKTAEEITLDIQKAYPWGIRDGWRYKKWLAVRRDFFEKHGLPLKPSKTSLKNLAAKAKLI